MDAKTKIEEIKEKRIDALTNLKTIDPRLRVGAEGRKRSAEEEVRTLEREYKDKIIENVAIVALKGLGAADFAEMAKNEYNYVTINFMEAADQVYQNVLKRGGKDTFSSNEYWMIVDELNRIKSSYGIVRLPQMQATFDDIGFGKPLRTAIHHLFFRHFGSSLYSVVTKGDIGTQALAIEFDGLTLPVLLYNYIIDLDPVFLPQPIKVLEIEESPSKSEVKRVLVQLRDSRKAQSGQNKET